MSARRRQPLELGVALWWRRLALCAAVCVAGCAAPPPLPIQPEAASGLQIQPGWLYRQQAVAAAHPLAAEAGLEMLRAGGSALDAAIAAQMVLGLVEPQSSGLGGGAFLLHFDGQRLQAFDGRETAPAAARPDSFVGPDGRPLPFDDAMTSGLAVGVPGAVRMLEAAHRQHGRLPWARLFEPAITLAQQGFAVSPRLHTLLQADAHLRKDPLARHYFYDTQGQAWPVGHVLRNPGYALVLRQLAREGSRALHEGAMARAIMARVATPPRPGAMTLQDLHAYQPRERQALCTDHVASHRTVRVCGFPPPSSGHVAIAQILGLLGHTRAQGPELLADQPSADFLHRYSEAARLAFADRAQYLADPDFVPAPAGDWRSLLAPDYLRERSQLIGPRPRHHMAPGQPGGQALVFAPMAAQPEFGTSHLSVVDAQGRMLAMTTTLEAGFGSRRMVSPDPALAGGFLLNNQLTDFSMLPTDAQGRPVANRLEPGKRPRSSMSPTLVFDANSGQPLMSLGSPGGALIIHYTAKALLGVLHWGLSPQAAVDLPNFGQLGGPLLLEEKRFAPATLHTLRERGHTLQTPPMTSGLHMLQQAPQGWAGAADPRREGQVRGD